jgi:hypothetical protein
VAVPIMKDWLTTSFPRSAEYCPFKTSPSGIFMVIDPERPLSVNQPFATVPDFGSTAVKGAQLDRSKTRGSRRRSMNGMQRDSARKGKPENVRSRSKCIQIIIGSISPFGVPMFATLEAEINVFKKTVD